LHKVGGIASGHVSLNPCAQAGAAARVAVARGVCAALSAPRAPPPRRDCEQPERGPGHARGRPAARRRGSRPGRCHPTRNVGAVSLLRRDLKIDLPGGQPGERDKAAWPEAGIRPRGLRTGLSDARGRHRGPLLDVAPLCAAGRPRSALERPRSRHRVAARRGAGSLRARPGVAGSRCLSATLAAQRPRAADPASRDAPPAAGPHREARTPGGAAIASAASTGSAARSGTSGSCRSRPRHTPSSRAPVARCPGSKKPTWYPGSRYANAAASVELSAALPGACHCVDVRS
jgi:hypothetical protein